jgi:RNA polymerase sigma factor (sigma-70 family)
MRNPGCPTELTIERARRADPKAWQTLYDMFQGMVRSTIQRFVDGDDIEDALQDTWLIALIKLPNLRNVTSFPAWLHAIAVSVCLTRLRSDRRRHYAHSLASRNFGSREYETMLRDVDLERAIGRLPFRRRQIIQILIDGHSLCEAAKILRITEGTAKSQAHKARRTLRATLECT